MRQPKGASNFEQSQQHGADDHPAHARQPLPRRRRGGAAHGRQQDIQHRDRPERPRLLQRGNAALLHLADRQSGRTAVHAGEHPHQRAGLCVRARGQSDGVPADRDDVHAEYDLVGRFSVRKCADGGRSSPRTIWRARRSASCRRRRSGKQRPSPPSRKPTTRATSTTGA